MLTIIECLFAGVCASSFLLMYSFVYRCDLQPSVWIQSLSAQRSVRTRMSINDDRRWQWTFRPRMPIDTHRGCYQLILQRLLSIVTASLDFVSVAQRPILGLPSRILCSF